MGNILKEFWYRNIDPSEQSTGKSQAVKELIELMGRNRDRLHNSMTAEQRETLAKYDDCVNEMHGIMELEIFSYAFRLGGRLMLATLMDICLQRFGSEPVYMQLSSGHLLPPVQNWWLPFYNRIPHPPPQASVFPYRTSQNNPPRLHGRPGIFSA